MTKLLFFFKEIGILVGCTVVESTCTAMKTFACRCKNLPSYAYSEKN